ncbi:hypothetical protein FO519_009185 [Halicephalobus sp. NKZ332]|nr:hypothetical protein FO519_009185 [Halicephalobus sp. NKZ332]
MGNTDSIPVVSQTKSIVQAISGDTEGAATSAALLITGNADEALEVQKEFVKGVSDVADGIPVVGHVKGTIHYVAGDTEGGDKAMKSASRTTGVVAGGVGGFFVGGPVGAVAGGIAGGAAMDGITTVVDSAVHDEYRPAGYIAAVENIIENPNAGDIFDTVAMPVFDGLTGYTAGQVANKIAAKANLNSEIAALQKEQNVLLEKMDNAATSQQAINYGNEAASLQKQIDANVGGSGGSGGSAALDAARTKLQSLQQQAAEGVAKGISAEHYQPYLDKAAAEVSRLETQSVKVGSTSSSKPVVQPQSGPHTQTSAQTAPLTRPYIVQNVPLREIDSNGIEYCTASRIDANVRAFVENNRPWNTVIRMGKLDQGSLHFLLRHFDEFQPFIPELDRSFMSNSERIAAEQCVTASTRAARRTALSNFESIYRRYHQIFTNQQILLIDWLRNVMTERNYMGRINIPRYQRYAFRLGGGRVLCVGVSSEVFPSFPPGIPTDYREIITIFIANESDVLPDIIP